MKKTFLLLILSTFLSLVIIEIFIGSIVYKKNDYDYRNTFLLFEQGKVFKNIDNFFVYNPDSNITASTYYLKNNNFIKVNSYNIKTNNFGLVQHNDLFPEKESLLILGDSLVQGQGYGNWTDNLYKDIGKYQIINGGILGTGPQQFLQLEKYLSKKLLITKVILLYIGDDFRRNLYNHDEQRLNCLQNYKNCDGSESFYGFPLKSSDPDKFLNFLKKQRFENNEGDLNFKKIRRLIKKKLSSLYIINMPVGFLRNAFYKSKNEKILKNFKAIEKLIIKYGDNIHFVNLTQKDEIIFRKKSYETIYANDFLSKKTNNIYQCNFNNDLELFFKYDAHPNEKGYNNIYTCLSKIIKKNL
tara:strand:+ start:298 stop:1365 length:1068 start_codon:yes stop_codon:yes gene_type:complete